MFSFFLCLILYSFFCLLFMYTFLFALLCLLVCVYFVLIRLSSYLFLISLLCGLLCFGFICIICSLLYVSSLLFVVFCVVLLGYHYFMFLCFVMCFMNFVCFYLCLLCFPCLSSYFSSCCPPFFVCFVSSPHKTNTYI